MKFIDLFAGLGGIRLALSRPNHERRRTEIDEAAWSELYSTKSRPFAKPEIGKISIKVINHYGGEVMKVYEV